MVKRKFAYLSKCLKIIWAWLSAKFLSIFMSLLTALILKYSHIFPGIYFIFLKKYYILNLKCFQYQISASVKRSEKYLSSKTIFSSFLHVSCSNYRLKLCQRLSSYKNCQTNQTWRNLGEFRSEKLFVKTVCKFFFRFICIC